MAPGNRVRHVIVDLVNTYTYRLPGCPFTC